MECSECRITALLLVFRRGQVNTAQHSTAQHSAEISSKSTTLNGSFTAFGTRRTKRPVIDLAGQTRAGLGGAEPGRSVECASRGQRGRVAG